MRVRFVCGNCGETIKEPLISRHYKGWVAHEKCGHETLFDDFLEGKHQGLKALAIREMGDEGQGGAVKISAPASAPGAVKTPAASGPMACKCGKVGADVKIYPTEEGGEPMCASCAQEHFERMALARRERNRDRAVASLALGEAFQPGDKSGLPSGQDLDAVEAEKEIAAATGEAQCAEEDCKKSGTDVSVYAELEGKSYCEKHAAKRLKKARSAR